MILQIEADSFLQTAQEFVKRFGLRVAAGQLGNGYKVIPVLVLLDVNFVFRCQSYHLNRKLEGQVYFASSSIFVSVSL